MNRISSYLPGTISTAFGAGAIAAGNWLLKKGNKILNEGHRTIGSVIHHIQPKLESQFNLFFESIGRNYDGVKTTINSLLKKGAITQIAANHLNDLLSEGIDQVKLGEGICNIARITTLAIGGGLCLYGVYKLAKAANEHFRG